MINEKDWVKEMLHSSSIGERIKIIRKNANKNQKDFAEELGISQSHISNIEKGADNPSLTLIKFICSLYDVNEEWLLNDSGDMYTYDSWGVSDEGLYSKFISFKRQSEMIIKKLTGEDRENYVQALSVLNGLISCYKLDKEEQHKYLQYVYGVIDYLEKLQFLISRYPNINSIKKVNYESFFHCINTAESYIDKINKNVKSIANVYLEKYNLPYKFKPNINSKE